MGALIRNLSLKYKFWAVNLVAFVTTLLLVLFALYQEQAGRIDAAREAGAAKERPYVTTCASIQERYK